MNNKLEAETYIQKRINDRETRLREAEIQLKKNIKERDDNCDKIILDWSKSNLPLSNKMYKELGNTCISGQFYRLFGYDFYQYPNEEFIYTTYQSFFPPVKIPID